MGGLKKEDDQHLFPIATHTNSYGDTPEPPTTNHCMSTQVTEVSDVGVRVTDHPKAQLPLTLPNQ